MHRGRERPSAPDTLKGDAGRARVGLTPKRMAPRSFKRQEGATHRWSALQPPWAHALGTSKAVHGLAVRRQDLLPGRAGSGIEAKPAASHPGCSIRFPGAIDPGPCLESRKARRCRSRHRPQCKASLPSLGPRSLVRFPGRSGLRGSRWPTRDLPLAADPLGATPWSPPVAAAHPSDAPEAPALSRRRSIRGTRRTRADPSRPCRLGVLVPHWVGACNVDSSQDRTHNRPVSVGAHRRLPGIA